MSIYENGATGGPLGAKSAVDHGIDPAVPRGDVICGDCRHWGEGANGYPQIAEDSICIHPESGRSLVTSLTNELCRTARTGSRGCGVAARRFQSRKME